MKNVLFIGVTHYDFKKAVPLHLEKKFSELNRGIKPYILSKGRPFGKKIWQTEFYLLPPNFYWPLAFLIAPWICFFKKIDVVIAQSPLIEGFLGSFLKLVLRKELIVEIHGDWQYGPFLSKKRTFAFIERRFTPFLAKISFKMADKIRGVSNDLLNRAKAIAPGKKYFFFPTFTDLSGFFAEKDVKLGNSVLFVGRNEEVKGPKYLIEAFAKIEKDFPDFKLVLVGEGMPEGRLPLSEVKNRMKDCYCLVVPSLSEGLPRVIMEAMALGKPVIGTKVGGIPELIKDGQTGFLVEAKDSQGLAEKLRILLGNKEMAIAMGQKGREIAQANFSNEKYISNYFAMINS
jgi:glycosyltransferase involved in cell wall biosynthesis